MSFINNLDIEEEESEFQNTLANTQFKCIASNKLLGLKAGISLEFRCRNPRGAWYTILGVSWNHNFPQPFGLHVIPSGTWDIHNVRLTGSLVSKACRLAAAQGVLERNKASFASAGQVAILKKQVSELKEEIERLEEEVDRAQASATKAKRKLHALRDSLEESKLEVVDKGKAIELPKQAELPSSSNPLPKKPNDDIFKSWSADGSVD
uniref:Uncharacterized protein n=1 Tax=Lake cress torradovirus TaxID=3115804 RepID=A0AAT9JJ65_9SECO